MMPQRLGDLTLNEFFFSPFSRCVKFESLTTLVKYKIWNLIFGRTRYKIKINLSTELQKSVVQCVLLCTLQFFLYILTAKFIKTGKKCKPTKTIKNLKFCRIIRTSQKKKKKKNMRGSFETELFFSYKPCRKII